MSYNSNTSPPPGLPMPRVTTALQLIQSQYSRIRDADTERYNFIEDLMTHVTTLTQERDEATRKLQRTEVSCDHYQRLLSEAQKSAETAQKAIDCDRFVLVLIDGDVTLFNNDYIGAGTSGGESAASDLNNAILDYLKPRDDFQHDFKIQIRIYCNLTGLAKAYSDADVISSPAIFHKFVQGFNKTHELLEIIDAGDLKEAADSKIKATFNLYRRNLHCKHILFAGSGDNSYAGFLGQMVHSATPTSPNLTLIKSLDFARDLQSLADRLDVTSFPSIFRNTKLISRKTSADLTKSSSDVVSASSVWHAAKPVTSSVNGATAALNGLSLKYFNNRNKASVNTIWVDSDGYRLDKPINNVDRELYLRLKEKKLCNRHHLRSDCDGYYCRHSHEGKLNEDEKKALRLVARSRPCQKGVWCEDPECVDGHRCAFADSCRKDNCWFSEEMHHTAEGTREKVPESYVVVT